MFNPIRNGSAKVAFRRGGFFLKIPFYMIWYVCAVCNSNRLHRVCKIKICSWFPWFPEVLPQRVWLQRLSMIWYSWQIRNMTWFEKTFKNSQWGKVKDPRMDQRPSTIWQIRNMTWLCRPRTAGKVGRHGSRGSATLGKLVGASQWAPTSSHKRYLGKAPQAFQPELWCCWQRKLWYQVSLQSSTVIESMHWRTLHKRVESC